MKSRQLFPFVFCAVAKISSQDAGSSLSLLAFARSSHSTLAVFANSELLFLNKSLFNAGLRVPPSLSANLTAARVKYLNLLWAKKQIYAYPTLSSSVAGLDVNTIRFRY